MNILNKIIEDLQELADNARSPAIQAQHLTTIQFLLRYKEAK